MLTPIELQLNRIAQGRVSHAEGSSWFRAQPLHERNCILRVLARVCQQSHPNPQGVSQAFAHAGLKTTFTPCVLLAKVPRPEQALNQVLELPAREQLKSFKLLLALFTIADTRRRQTQCMDGCSHEWHNLPAL